MSLGYLLVKINQGRVQNKGQPPEESIRVSSVISFPGRLNYDFVETMRFSDYTQSGDYSNRYIHLLGLPYGICINSIENFSLGRQQNSRQEHQRLIGGIYDERSLIMSADFVSLPSLLQEEDMSIVSQKLFSSSSLSLSGVIAFSENVSEEILITTEVNCVECYPDRWRFFASLKIPEYILSEPHIENIDGMISQSYETFSQGPWFFASDIRIADSRLIFSVDKQSMAINCDLQIGRHDMFSVAVESCKIA